MVRIKRLSEKPSPVYRRGSLVYVDDGHVDNLDSSEFIDRFLELIRKGLESSADGQVL